MCLSRVLVPQRVPHPGSPQILGRLHVESGGDVSGERDTLPLDSPSRHLDSALELLVHVGGTQLLATVHQPPVTHGDRQDGRTVSEGGAPGVSSRPENRGHRSNRQRRELPP
jgi:hypothetical protein